MTSKVLYSCVTCGSQFFKLPSQVMKRAFCSTSCYAQALRWQAPHNKGKRVYIEKPCQVCGGPISGRPSEVSRRKFCSQKCMAKAFSIQDINGYLDANTQMINGSDCWFWTGSKRGGYGRIKVDGVAHEAHRISYERHIGEIPAGLELDHLCRNRSCINPEHLEPVTHVVNVRRGMAGKVLMSEAHKKAISEGGKRRFADPKTRAAQLLILDVARASPTRMDSIRVALRSPEYRKRQSDITKVGWIKRKAKG